MGVCSRVHRFTDPSGIWMGHVTTPCQAQCMQAWVLGSSQCVPTCKETKQIGHHVKPKRTSALAPVRIVADRCKTGSYAGNGAGATAAGPHSDEPRVDAGPCRKEHGTTY